MKDELKIALWDKVKSTYPSGTSKHTNALLEEDFDSFLDEVVKICAIPDVVNRRELLLDFADYSENDKTSQTTDECVDNYLDSIK